MTTIAAICNGAGSAGKTTLATAAAAVLAQAGRRVLVVDLDGQANATAGLGIRDTDDLPTIGDVLMRTAALKEVVVECPHLPGLWVAPSSAELDAVSVELGRAIGGQLRLKQALAHVDELADIVILDCPGTAGWAVVAALAAATSVIAVTRPSLKELEGLPKLEALVTEVAEAFDRPTLHIDAVVPSEVPPASAGRLYADGMDLLTRSYSEIVTSGIRRSVTVPTAYAQGVPLPVWEPHAPVTEDIRTVVDTLVQRGAL